MKRTSILILLTALVLATVKAQTTFSVMTLNVDGLPGKLFGFDVNKDGPQADGSLLISQYIAAQNCDIVSMQECFNYPLEIWSHLFSDFHHDEWTGGIDLVTHPLDFFHLQNERFPCDGLNTAWKSSIASTAYERVPHEKSFGKFSHAFDDIITKGFRRHEFTLSDGTEIVVYNTHFDASSDRDENVGNDTKDREARLAQWQQLRTHVLEHLDSRPVILTGDFNSYYNRDDVVGAFIKPIEDSGLATVGDAWQELNRSSRYPSVGDEKDDEEMLDKVLYVNPVGGTQLKPVSATVDKDGYLYDGKPLGDHYPLIVSFAVADDGHATGIRTVSLTDDAQRYDLLGRPVVKKARKGIYVVKNKKITE